MNELTFHALETERDWQEAIDLRNAFLLTDPLLVEEVRTRGSQHPKEASLRRYVARQDEKAVAYGTILQAYWLDDPTRYEILTYARVSDDLTTYFRETVEFLIERAREHNAKTIGTHAPNHFDGIEQVLHSLGFHETQRNPVSALMLEEFDPSPFEATEREVSSKGFEIVSLEILKQRQPETWMEEAWKLEMDLMSDVPLPRPFQGIPFDTFKQQLLDPHSHLSSMFVAVKDGVWAGLSQIHPNRVDAKFAMTGLTGVRRQFRRQKLATALKVHALRWAKQSGIERIGTDNEENNPMLQLNVQLGFKKESDLVVMEKPLGQP